jgi:DNA repair photolyase
VKHNPFVTRGAEWGSFLEVRENAAEAYLARADAERRWARRSRGRFSIFMSSATDPFVPHERRFRVSRAVLRAMVENPPDELVVQTHTHLVTERLDELAALAEICSLRVHISIESDRDRLPGLPPPASPVARRFEAARALRGAGIQVVITVAPLLPIGDPDAFFARIAECADTVVVDHFVGGDGSNGGARTLRTPLPEAMAALDPASVHIAYREGMVARAVARMPGRVGVGIDGFAGRLLPPRADC